MSTISTYVDVDLSDIDDDDMIEELEARGYKILMRDHEDQHPEIQEAIWRFKNGYLEDTVMLLERHFPELYGLSKRLSL
jgi:hypothetical protein